MPCTTLSREMPSLVTTCLKWTPDGELSTEDRTLLLHRLVENDRRRKTAPDLG